MIAKNYIKFPEALRFQKELFADTFGKHYTIMSRLVQCICNWKDKAPQWVLEMKERAARLVKRWKAAQIEISLTMNKIAMFNEND